MRLLIKNGTLIDGAGPESIPNILIAVDGNRISHVGPMRAETPDDTEVRQFWHCNAVPKSSRTSITAGTALFEGISIWPTIALRVSEACFRCS
jgi:hypothetical protein